MAAMQSPLVAYLYLCMNIWAKLSFFFFPAVKTYICDLTGRKSYNLLTSSSEVLKSLFVVLQADRNPTSLPC